jgi:TRAP-type C4-dicarboxylate transport system substrate-binding protein
LIEYVCPVCRETIRVRGNNIHNHYVEDLSKKFEKEGYKIIQEGKMPERIKEWYGPVYEQLIKTVYEGKMKRIIWNEPDIFVLRDLN